MIETRFTKLVGCSVPIQSAPMGGQMVTADLVAAVTGAGGHAMLAMAGMPPPVAVGVLHEVGRIGTRAWGANFLTPFISGEVLELVASTAPVVDFYLGVPDKELVRLVHAGGGLAGWQITSLEEARRAVAAGCDFIIAHGVEAGGRIPSGIGLFPLLEQVLPEVDVPVVAAGGIATGRGVAAALAAGADAVRLGTRFLACQESGAHPDYVAAVVAAKAEDTVRTDAFATGMPPEVAGARVLRSAVAAAERVADEVVGEAPAGPGQTTPIPRFGASPPTRGTTGNVAAMALYAGESAGAIHDVRGAAEIVTDLMREAEELLARW